jgi:hypothetical protein
MSNKHVFISILRDKIISESTIIEKKIFYSKIIDRKIFSSIVDKYTPSSTLFARFRNIGNISISSINSETKIKNTIMIGNMNIVVNSNATSLNQLPKINMVFRSLILPILKMEKRADNTVIFNNSNITARGTGRISVKASVFTSSASIIAVITGKKYYLVNEWDNSMLNTLDSSNLQAMDYQSV